MSTKIYPSFKDLTRLCKKALSKTTENPEVVITFSSGGLYTTGCFQKAGLKKVPVYSLPWTRNSDFNKFEVTGAPIWDCLSRFLLIGSPSIFIIDDVFDTGATISRLFDELSKYPLPHNDHKLTLLAPYSKKCFPKEVFEQPTCIGKELDSETWIVFPWES